MEVFDVYKDIQARTNGEIYLVCIRENNHDDGTEICTERGSGNFTHG